MRNPKYEILQIPNDSARAIVCRARSTMVTSSSGPPNALATSRRRRRNSVGVEQTFGTFNGDEQSHAAGRHSHFRFAIVQYPFDSLYLIERLYLRNGQAF